jgi:CheY-like chemotaxis protein
MTKTILLADDSVTIQKVVELTFMDGDYHVVAVGNGSDAAARLVDVRPDLVLADVHMPGINGYDLCRRVKEWEPRTPVLLLVGTFEPFDRDEFVACGAQGHLKKPFDSQDLQRQVDEMLESSAIAEPQTTVAGAEEPAWILSDPEPEPPPLPSSVWAEPAAAAPAWEPAAQPAAGDAPLPEPTWQGKSALSWEESHPAAAAFVPPAEPAAPAVSTPAWSASQTASISSDQIRTVTAMSQPPTPAPASNVDRPLSEEEVDRIARRVVELLGDRVVRDVSWEVIPDLAEVIIKDRIRELEAQSE